MCGIAGFFSSHPIPRAVPTSVLKILEARGPDAQNAVLWNAAFQQAGDYVSNGLLNTRLAIIDPRPVANQPMCNASQDVWVVYNGEVYDWDASLVELQATGALFQTHCDTEFILKAYEAWGIGCLNRLRGMFAIAILDLRKKELWLVRDRFGQKPLVYAHHDGGLAFASTVRAMIPFLDPGHRSLNPQAIDAYLAHRYVPAPSTVFKDIGRLESGHWLRFDLQSRRIEKARYWATKPTRAALPATLDEAISIQTVSDRPWGLFLSSGVDSTTIASRLAALGKGGVPTITAAFPGSSMDESRDALATATRLGFENVTVPMPRIIATDFAQIVSDLDEPFADPSSFPMWYLCQAAARRVKMVLGGDGLDELLGGYKRIRRHMRTAWRRHWAAPWLPLAAGASPKGWRKWGDECRMSWLEAYSLRFSGFTPSQRRFLQPDLGPAPITHWRIGGAATNGDLEALLQVDFENYLPEYVLRKADLCSMAHGLELRAPYLDHHFVQAMVGLERSERFTEPPKRIVERMYPDLVELDLFGRKKRGFNPPVRPWLVGDLQPRFHNLGTRLRDSTSGQIDGTAVDAYCSRYCAADDAPDEQLLQLIVLDESLAQLQALCRAT